MKVQIVSSPFLKNRGCNLVHAPLLKELSYIHWSKKQMRFASVLINLFPWVV